MPAIDFGLAWDFIDPTDRVPRQLRFQRNWAPPGDPRIFDGTGQLVAVVADRAGLGIGRGPNTANLATIRRRIHAAGLD